MKKLSIGVLMGGKSLEKEVSLNSGRTVCDHLDISRYEVVPLYQNGSELFILPWHFLHRGKTTDFEHRLCKEAFSIAWDDLKNYVDFIYVAQHGRYAEDGVLQGFLNILGIPYLGSNILSSAICMDKGIQKSFLQNAGIHVPKFIIVEPYEIDDFAHYEKIIIQRLLCAGINEQCVVKPCNEGSSLGISVVKVSNLESALKLACYIESGEKKRVLIEEKINGMEFTCITLVDYASGKFIALPPTESIPESGTDFFDYEQKYMPGRGIKRTPAHCSSEIIDLIQRTCISVMKSLNISTVSRIDGFVTKDGKVIILEPNTFCGMAPSSYIFNQAAVVNMSPSYLINYIIELELYRYGMLDRILEREKMELNTMNASKIRVAILLGGRSNEKETSLDSGRNVFYKLDRRRYEVIPLFVDVNMELYHLASSQIVRNSTQEIVDILDVSQKVKWNDLPKIADFVFNGLHGGEGEDGSVQGALEILNMPYNGSSVLASALCMNKYKANQLLLSYGVEVPCNVFVEKDKWNYNKQLLIDMIEKTISFPMIVKPYDDGCSVMVSCVYNNSELIAAIEVILLEKDAVLVEEFIQGMELTVGVLGNDSPYALPPSQAVAVNGILSIEEKFLPGAGENQTPAPLSSEAIVFVQSTIVNAYKILQCRGYARIDCFYQSADQSPSKKERVIILEVNTLPGMTPATCLFHQAAEIGLKPMELVDTIIKFGFEAHSGTNRSFYATNVSEDCLKSIE